MMSINNTLGSHASYAMSKAKAMTGNDSDSPFAQTKVTTSRGSFTDTSRLNTEENLNDALEKFEGLFVRMMLKEARKASDSIGGNLFSNSGTKQFRSMQDDQLADEFAKSANLGIAEGLKRQLAGKGSSFDMQQQSLKRQNLHKQALDEHQKYVQSVMATAKNDPEKMAELEQKIAQKAREISEQFAPNTSLTLPVGMQYSGADLKRKFMNLPNPNAGMPLK